MYYYIIKKYNTNGNITNEQRSGGPKKLTPREEKLLLREMATMVVTNFNKEVHPQLCQRMLWKNNFHGRVPREKPYISKKNKLLRLKFAKEYINKDINFWNTYFFG